jgi:hypothetical protein
VKNCSLPLEAKWKGQETTIIISPGP